MRHLFTATFVLSVAFASACTGGGGLAFDFDGGGPAGGGGGVGGGGGGGGTTGRGGNGASVDGGPTMCPGIICPAVVCQYGFQKDSNGCGTCQCSAAPVCPALTCPIPQPADAATPLIQLPPACAFGRAKDGNGCDTCTCLPPPACDTRACDGSPKDLNCPPNATGGYACVHSSPMDNGCRWQLNCIPIALPFDCAQVRDRRRCQLRDIPCGWLEPGCVDPKVPAGCYNLNDLECGPAKACAAGKICVRRNVDTCPTGASVGGIVCRPGVCHQSINICL